MDLEAFEDNQSIIVQYFNPSTGRMYEKLLVGEGFDENDECLILTETVGGSVYRIERGTDNLEVLRPTEERWRIIGHDLTLEEA